MDYRIMDISDYKQVYDLWINTPGMGLNTTDDSEEGIARFLCRNPGTSFVAEDDGRIVGVVLAGHDGRRGYIYHTAVMEKYRNNNVGRRLVEHVMNALEKENISKAALVVFDRNESGNGFWEHLGFTVREDLLYRNRNIRELVKFDT